MLGITLYRFDQIRYQVIAPSELDINLRPGVIAAVSQNNQAVVNGYTHDEQQPDNNQENDQRTHLFLLSSPVFIFKRFDESRILVLNQKIKL